MKNSNLQKIVFVLFAAVALPVLVYAFSTQKFDIRNHAQITTNSCSVSSDCDCGIDSQSNYCAIENKDNIKTKGCSIYPNFCSSRGTDSNCKPACVSGSCTLSCPNATPYPVPDCTGLTLEDGDLNNLLVGKDYVFNLTAASGVDNAPVTSVEITPYGESGCYDLLKGYSPLNIDGPGTYKVHWTPPKAGKFTIIGNVWNDSRTQCRADCIDGYPRFFCASAASCKLTGTAVEKIVPTPTATPSKLNVQTPSPDRTFNPQPTDKPNSKGNISILDFITFIIFSSIVGGAIYYFFKKRSKKSL